MLLEQICGWMVDGLQKEFYKMTDYLKTIYFRDEYAEDKYPQKLCDHLIEKIISPFFLDKIIGKSLLDVGSGKGNHLVGFARRKFVVKGLDIKPECINILDKFDIKKCDIEKEVFPFEDESFDIVFSKSVLEHVLNADNFFEQIFRVLKQKGLVILITPDWKSHHEVFWDDYTHVKPWTRKSLQNIMRIKDFEQVSCSFFRQLPVLWKYPWLKIFCNIVSLFPHSLKWKDDKEEEFRTFIRFSKEKELLAVGRKP